MLGLHDHALNRSQYVGHVSLSYDFDPHDYGKSALKCLANFTGLRRFDIEVDEAKWTKQADIYRGIKKYDNVRIDNLPGLASLPRVKADKVSFHGPCPTLEKMLKAQMTRPPKTVEGKTSAREAEGAGRRWS